MQDFFVNYLGVSESLFAWVILPCLIFLARITDVSIGTVRILLMMNGKKKLATFLGFCESLIWVTVITAIFKQVNNPLAYVAYAGGYATGTFIGMTLENKLAVGKVLVRFITRQDASALVEHLKTTRFGFTNVKAEGHKGGVNLIFSVVERKDLKELVDVVKSYHPKAFYSVEATKYASEPIEDNEEESLQKRKQNFFQLFMKDFLKRK
ncbi:MAG: DUF2179 domain-containing protein [Raineya sp.]|jgi:uncharacterized protein YebE (UPF0316 family)|nr:DUF2179 domain-containing protein [Raineya sp.]